MAIQSIQNAKKLKEYCKKLGREGVAKRIIEIAQEIVKEEGAYVSTLVNAGRIRALCLGGSVDSYWDEKQEDGFYKMLHEAERETYKASDNKHSVSVNGDCNLGCC